MGQLNVEYPAALDLLHAIEEMGQMEVPLGESSGGNEIKDKLQNLQANATIGHAVAVSGIRKNKNSHCMN